MDKLINKVKTLVHSSNQNEQKLSQLIVERQFDLSELSATKVGALLGISDSSVIRYAKSLGCSGFPDLKLKLAAQAPQVMARTAQSVYASIETGDSTAQIIEKAKHLFVSTIEQSIGLMDAESVEQCAQQLLKANKIALAGIGASAIVAADINH